MEKYESIQPMDIVSDPKSENAEIQQKLYCMPLRNPIKTIKKSINNLSKKILIKEELEDEVNLKPQMVNK